MLDLRTRHGPAGSRVRVPPASPAVDSDGTCSFALGPGGRFAAERRLPRYWQIPDGRSGGGSAEGPRQVLERACRRHLPGMLAVRVGAACTFFEMRAGISRTAYNRLGNRVRTDVRFEAIWGCIEDRPAR